MNGKELTPVVAQAQPTPVATLVAQVALVIRAWRKAEIQTDATGDAHLSYLARALDALKAQQVVS